MAAARLPAGAPPQGTDGVPATVHGVPILAGLHHPLRAFGVRATNEDLWADLSIAATLTGSQNLPWGAVPTAEDRARFAAFITQARSFYFAAISIDVRSRPLPAYYSLLNLAKAWLTVASPATTAGKMLHGSSDALPAGAYAFAQERFTVKTAGVLAEIAKRTGNGFVYAANTTLILANLLASLCEATDYAAGGPSSLVPLRRLTVMQGDVPRPGAAGAVSGALWLRAELDRSTNVAPRALLAAAPQFAANFTHVQGDDAGVYRFETAPHRYGRNTALALPNVLKKVATSMIQVDRVSTRNRYFVFRGSANELSQEARTFGVMHHLSNMVRYRPDHVEHVAASEHSWLLGTWVPRALENSLMTYSTRILGRETMIA